MKNPSSIPSSLLILKNFVIPIPDSSSILVPDIQLVSGDILLIKWPSGVGKTTFLHMMVWLLPFPEGECLYQRSWEVKSIHESDFSIWRRNYIGISFSNPLFFESLSLRDNILFPSFVWGRKYDPDWFDTLIDGFQMRDFLMKKVEMLSSGQRERAELIRVLLYKPKFLFLDEAASHLDMGILSEFLKLLALYRQSVAPIILMVTHTDYFDHLATNHLHIIRDHTKFFS